ncbi:MAG: hypothetical protein ABI895_43415, partial [Deltaproteobacteria bacterium]
HAQGGLVPVGPDVIRMAHCDQPREARLIEAQAKVFAGLRGLGFREGEVRTVMAIDGAVVDASGPAHRGGRRLLRHIPSQAAPRARRRR